MGQTQESAHIANALGSDTGLMRQLLEARQEVSRLKRELEESASSSSQPARAGTVDIKHKIQLSQVRFTHSAHANMHVRQTRCRDHSCNQRSCYCAPFLILVRNHLACGGRTLLQHQLPCLVVVVHSDTRVAGCLLRILTTCMCVIIAALCSRHKRRSSLFSRKMSA